MSQLLTKPWINKIGLNLNSFTMRFSRQIQGQPVIQEGPQTPGLFANIGLYYDKRNAGSRSYIFGKDETPAEEGRSDVLPSYTELLDSAEIASVTNLIEQTVKNKVSAQNSGISIYTRLNRIETNFPYNQPDNYYIAAVLGVYEDAAYKYQINDADLMLLYVNDGYVMRYLNPEDRNNPSATNALRVENDWLSLSEFLQTPEVVTALSTVVSNLFETLQAKVFNWKTLNVGTALTDFQSALATIAGTPSE